VDGAELAAWLEMKLSERWELTELGRAALRAEDKPGGAAAGLGGACERCGRARADVMTGRRGFEAAALCGPCYAHALTSPGERWAELREARAFARLHFGGAAAFVQLCAECGQPAASLPLCEACRAAILSEPAQPAADECARCGVRLASEEWGLCAPCWRGVL
jgi:hypothetical protein